MYSTVPVVFYGSSVYGIFCFIQLAQKWPRIMRRWETIEAKMPPHRTQAEKRQLARRIKMLAFTVLMSALGSMFDKDTSKQISWLTIFFDFSTVEHILNMISIVYYSQNCLDPNEPVKEFFRVQLSQIYAFLPYSPWISFFGKFLNVVATFCKQN